MRRGFPRRLQLWRHFGTAVVKSWSLPVLKTAVAWRLRSAVEMACSWTVYSVDLASWAMLYEEAVGLSMTSYKVMCDKR